MVVKVLDTLFVDLGKGVEDATLLWLKGIADDAIGVRIFNEDAKVLRAKDDDREDVKIPPVVCDPSDVTLEFIKAAVSFVGDAEAERLDVELLGTKVSGGSNLETRE